MIGIRNHSPPIPWVVPTLAVVAVAIVALSLGGATPKPCCEVAYAVHLPAPLSAGSAKLVQSVVGDEKISVSVEPPRGEEPARVLVCYRGDDASAIHTVRHAAHRVAHSCRVQPLGKQTLDERRYSLRQLIADLEHAGASDPGEVLHLSAEGDFLAALAQEGEATQPRVEKLRAIRRAPQGWVKRVPAVLLLVLAAAVLRMVAPNDGKRLATRSDASVALALPAREVVVVPGEAA